MKLYARPYNVSRFRCDWFEQTKGRVESETAGPNECSKNYKVSWWKIGQGSHCEDLTLDVKFNWRRGGRQAYEDQSEERVSQTERMPSSKVWKGEVFWPVWVTEQRITVALVYRIMLKVKELIDSQRHTGTQSRRACRTPWKIGFNSHCNGKSLENFK